MNKTGTSLALLAVLGSVFLISGMSRDGAATRYLHVRVANPARHELVRINVPLSVAETIIPAINDGRLRDGKVRIEDLRPNVNIRAIVDALKTIREGELVTVEDARENIRVAKERGQLVVHVKDQNGRESVEVTIPWEAAEALVRDADQNQLDIAAGIKALENAGDTTLVRVSDRDEQVRVWVDSRNSDGD